MPSLLSDPEPNPTDEAEALRGGSSYRAYVESFAGAITEPGKDVIKGFGQGRGSLLDPEDANRDYGVEGELTFERPTYEADAARRQHAAQRRAFQKDVIGRSELGPLARLGGALHGALLDPLALPLIFAPEIMGVRGALEGSAVFRAGGVLGKAGRLAAAGRYGVIGGVEGAVGGALYEGAAYGLGGQDDPDAELGDHLRNVLLGTVLGGGLGATLGGVFGHAAHPRAVAALDEESRLAATLLAVDDVIADRPVSVARVIEAELPRPPAREALRTLDDVDGGPRIAAREIEDGVAVTSRGREIPVRYALVEMDDLVTSHTDDLERNAAFPEALQPRDRSRAGSQAGNYRLEAELNPKRLMREPGAETGAPLIAPDGTVESGNGRTIALRRSARTGSEAYGRYRAELAAQGFDTTGMRQPVLVRVRAERLDGEGRAQLAREMNAAPTEAMGPSEQAMADAASIDDGVLGHLDGTAQGDRAFARAFIARVAPDQQNSLVDGNGALSAQGQARMKAALVARAYDDPRLVEAVFETADPNIRTLGAALADAAPGWARMRAAAARGEIPAELDVTQQLRAAVDMIRHARDNKIPVDEWIAQRLDQRELFGGGVTVDAETEAFLRMFFRDGSFKRHRSSDKIAWALKDYARQASDVAPGPNLFGDTPDGEARLILDGLARKFAGEDAFPGPSDLLDLAPQQSEPARIDLRPDGGDGGGKGVQPGGGEGAAGGVADNGPAGQPDAAQASRRLDAASKAVATAERQAQGWETRIAELEAEAQRLATEAEASRPIVETRGQGQQYHGARGPIDKLTEGYASENNIYGGWETFYTTDAVDIAKGYGRKNPSAVIYEIREHEPVRMYDMEAQRPVDEWNAMMGVKPDDTSFEAEAIELAAEEAGGAPNLREIMDQMRSISRDYGMPKYEVQDVFDAIVQDLKKQGFGGMRHVGGLRTGRDPHEVKIYFEAWNQLEIRQVELPRADAGAEALGKVAEAQRALDEARLSAKAAADRVARETTVRDQQAANLQALEARKQAAAQQADALIDPELKALAERDLADAPPLTPRDDPAVIAEAIRAAAFCLKEG